MAEQAPAAVGHITYVHPFDLKQSPDNPRTITDERLAALKYAPETDPEMLEARPVIATPDRLAVGGNQRVRAAKEMIGDDAFPRFNAYIRDKHGMPVFLAELDAARRREWMMRDNNPYGEWDDAELAKLVTEHARDGGDMDLLGFDDANLKRLLEHGGGNDDDPNPDTSPQLGDVLYRLIIECGSEGEQAELLTEFQERGLDVQAVAV